VSVVSGSTETLKLGWQVANEPSQLPAPVIDKVGRFYVVRDDLLPGGTKMRYILPLIQSRPSPEWVYASPAFGYAQIALACCCAMIGVAATIFTAARREMHIRTRRAKEAGAKVVVVPNGYLSVVQAKARAYAKEAGASLLPFGVDDPQAMAEFANAVGRLSIEPKEVWTCAGSGALTRALQEAWPNANFNAVQIGKECNVGRARVWTAPEKFEQTVQDSSPPFPSCDNYDAKAWRFIQAHGADDALFWNVAA
jgi:hypothetical protein